MGIGCPGRPFATADPGLDDLLPADDAAWEQGVGFNALNGFCMLMNTSDCEIS